MRKQAPLISIRGLCRKSPTAREPRTACTNPATLRRVSRQFRFAKWRRPQKRSFWDPSKLCLLGKTGVDGLFLQAPIRDKV
jgi:hypothetical protein